MESTVEKVQIQHSGLTQISQYCPERPILEVNVPKNALRIRKLVLKTLSNDQGTSMLHTGCASLIQNLQQGGAIRVRRP